MPSKLEEKINYTFKNPKFLKEALTHPSFKRISKTNESYQRLEFLGDKVLSLIISDLLLEKYPNENEGGISKRLASIVRGKSLFEIAMQIELGDFIILTKNQAVDGGRKSENILENVLEAIIGAVYKDGGIEKAQNVICLLFKEALQNISKTPPQDPKSAFQEYFQKKYKILPEYKTSLIEGGMFRSILIFGNKEITATAKSIKEAEKLVAEIALKNI